MKEGMDCPNGHGEMVLSMDKKRMTFRGVEIIFPVEQYVCSACGVEAETGEQVACIQKTIADAYRKAVKNRKI
jgi:hypothetical protein